MNFQDSDVECEIVEDEVEHEELGGVVFELEIVDPIPEQADAVNLLLSLLCIMDIV